MTNVSGFGRYPTIDATIDAPRSYTQMSETLVKSQKPCLARGMGRSYGDSALAPVLLMCTQFNMILAFDVDTGVVRCEAGVTFRDLLSVCVPKGWFVPVTPGTQYVTMAGAIASDVHGKNHHHVGCMSQWVRAIKIMLGDGSIMDCSQEVHPELFRATCGGMGLTGIILEITLQLIAIDSAYIEQTTFKVPTLESALEAFEIHQDASYSVAWIDVLSRGSALGRSVIMLGETAKNGEWKLPEKRCLSVPIDLPSFCLNRYTVSAFNSLYFNRAPKQQINQVAYTSFFYPLDVVQNWNRLYGRSGFTQYQCVIPKAAGLEGLRKLLMCISDAGLGSFLSVLKMFGKENQNYLSFPMEGYTLALDFKIQPKLFPLLNTLDHIVLDHGGRLYLTKDCRMSANVFQQSYPQWQVFEEIRKKYSAIGVFGSEQSKRLGLA